MSLEGPDPYLLLGGIRDLDRSFPGSLIRQVSAMMPPGACGGGGEVEECRDDAAAMRLKMVAVAAILVAGVVGVATPLVGQKRRCLKTDGGFLVLAKAFAAGVILATGFVHMLHDAEEALTNPCLPEFPWRRFPFSGFVAMAAALGTLVVDFVATQFYSRKHRKEASAASETAPEEEGIVVIAVAPEEAEGDGEEAMHIVGMRAHAAEHRHSHADGGGACEGMTARRSHGHGHDHGHGHSHGHTVAEDNDEVSPHARHVVVSQILELGIVSHSVIIGLSLGVSRSPCAIRPLVAALSFHQFFEGFALGGCISQARFGGLSSALMAFFFAITTPFGIVVGALAARSFYDPHSAMALAVEGLLDSASAGILIYMALVDLIAADFLSRRMSCNFRLQVLSYAALLLGAVSMSSLALWA